MSEVHKPSKGLLAGQHRRDNFKTVQEEAAAEERSDDDRLTSLTSLTWYRYAFEDGFRGEKEGKEIICLYLRESQRETLIEACSNETAIQISISRIRKLLLLETY